MSQISTGRDEVGRLFVAAQSAHAGGRVVLLGDEQFVLDGDFGGPALSVAVLDLLIVTLQETKRHVTVPEIPDGATLVARCVTDESVEDGEYVESDDPDIDDEVFVPAPNRQLADIAIRVDGGDGTPIATYTVHTNPLSLIGEAPHDVLERHGWRIVGDRGLDESQYRTLVVERAAIASVG